MDPFSIAAAAAGLADIAWRAGREVKRGIDDTRAVEEKLRGLSVEVTSLGDVLSLVEGGFKDVRLSTALTKHRDPFEVQLTGVDKLLTDCQTTLAKLEELLKSVNAEDRLSKTFLRQPLLAMKLSSKMPGIALIRQQILSYTSAMQLAVQMLGISLSVYGGESVEALGNELRKSMTSLHNTMSEVRNQVIKSRMTTSKTPDIPPENESDNEKKLENLENYVRAAESVYSGVSTYFGSTSGTIMSEVPPLPAAPVDTLGSVQGMTYDKEAYLERWKSGTGFDKDDEDDEDFEALMLMKRLEIADKKFRNKQFPDAEAQYVKCLKAMEDSSKPAHEIFDLKLNLAIAYCAQQKFGRAQDLLKDLGNTKDISQAQYLHAQHNLAEAYLYGNDTSTAIPHAMIAMKGRRKLFKHQPELFYQSVYLNSQIYHVSGDEAESEFYKSLLPEDYHAEASPWQAAADITPSVRINTVAEEKSAKQLLLDNGYDILLAESRKRALVWAGKEGHDAVLRCLLGMGTDIEAQDDDGKTALCCAAANGQEKALSTLLERGAHLETKTADGRTPLISAAEYGHELCCRRLLRRGAMLEAKDDEYGQTPLLWAAEKGHQIVIRTLLRAGAAIETKDYRFGYSALNWAALGGHEPVVRLLLQRGAAIESRSAEEWTPLLLAANKGHEGCTKTLLERGAAIEARTESELTPLLLAADAGHENVVRLLLNQGAAIEARNSNEWTPLLMAASEGRLKTVELLLSRGANLEARNAFGWTALILAANGGFTPVARLLLDKGTDIEAATIERWTSLLSAAFNGHEETTKLLLDRGANMKATNGEGWNCLQLAANKGQDAIVSYLVNRGTELEVKNSFGYTALTSAAKNGHKGPIEILLEAGADIHATLQDGCTALMLAAEDGHDETCALLLDRGIPLDSRDNSNNTAFIWAAKSGKLSSTKLLKERGADISLKDKDGKTGLALATEREHKEVIRYLDPTALGDEDAEDDETVVDEPINEANEGAHTAAPEEIGARA